MKQIVVFASGSGTNFQSIIDAIHAGKIVAKVTGLIAGKPNIKAIERARKNDIPFEVLANSTTADEILSLLDKWKPDLIVLAGYMRKIPAKVIEEYPNQIINIHPSLLPQYGGKGYYGMNVHRAVLENGEKKTGCTVHYVNDKYDDGPIINQRIVDVKPEDSPELLAARVLEEEHKLLPETIQQLLNSKT